MEVLLTFGKTKRLKMTTFFNEIKQLNQNKINFLQLLNDNNYEYKETMFIKDTISIVVIDNNIANKLSYGVNYGIGKQKIYYIKEDYTIILLDNTFGSNGQGNSYSTENSYSILKSNNIKKYNSLKKLKINYSIRDFERTLKSIFNIKPIVKKPKKYDSEYDFALGNPTLFSKYVKTCFEGTLFFNNLSDSMGMFDNKYLISEKLNLDFDNYDSIKKKINNFITKINTQIKCKLNKNHSLRQFLILLTEIDVKKILNDNNIHLIRVYFPHTGPTWLSCACADSYPIHLG